MERAFSADRVQKAHTLYRTVRQGHSFESLREKIISGKIDRLVLDGTEIPLDEETENFILGKLDAEISRLTKFAAGLA